MTDEKAIGPKIRFSAMNLMARREHSRLELLNKLESRFPEFMEEIELELDKLEDDGLLNDARFTELFIDSCSRKGKGPNQIKQLLRQKGISDQLCAEAFANCELDWFELAEQVFRKKFSESGCSDLKQLAKQKRFLQYRGFTHDQIAYCINSN